MPLEEEQGRLLLLEDKSVGALRVVPPLWRSGSLRLRIDYCHGSLRDPYLENW